MNKFYAPIFDFLENTPAAEWKQSLPDQLSRAFDSSRNGHIPSWEKMIDNIPPLSPSKIDLDSDKVLIGSAYDCDESTRLELSELLMNFHPWRKGPYYFFGIDIDTEWRSDLKWNRLKDHISSLEGRCVFDVGCGNGYHCMRCLGAGAKAVIGVDPFLVFVMQHLVLRNYISELPFWVLPFGIEQVPKTITGFDTVFSMGVLYHRRSPIDHLKDLSRLLRPGGELVLETLIINEGDMLIPKGRYAKMRNVWFIPSPAIIETCLTRCGFKNIHLVNVSTTSTVEQRSTEWMTFESLPDFLDPNNPALTLEGYPAPVRAVFLAEK